MNIELNKIYLGDCLEIMKSFKDKSIDIIITDPPYGISFRSNYRKEKYDHILGDSKFNTLIINEFFRIARNAVYIFCRWNNLFNNDLPMPKSVITWIKNNWSMGDLNHEHARSTECICFYNLEMHKFIKRIPDHIFANRTGNNFHPTEKPIYLIEKIINCNYGKTILDPYIGSGTTAIACLNTNRQYIGIEKDEKYFNKCNERIRKHLLLRKYQQKWKVYK